MSRKKTIASFVVHSDEAPDETPGALAAVKKYHGPLFLVFERICEHTDRHTTDEEHLQVYIYAVSCTVGRKAFVLQI